MATHNTTQLSQEKSNAFILIVDFIKYMNICGFVKNGNNVVKTQGTLAQLKSHEPFQDNDEAALSIKLDFCKETCFEWCYLQTTVNLWLVTFNIRVQSIRVTFDHPA